MARISALEERRLDLRRAVVTLAVVAAHVALIIVMLRSAGHSADVEDIVDITLVALPIDSEDRPRKPVNVPKPPISPTAPGRTAAARKSATEQHVEPSLRESSRSDNDTPGNAVAVNAGAASEPAPPIDWHAEVGTSARALEQHASIERGRRSLAGPNQPALSASPKTPACPFEKCEPGWGANLGIFKSLRSKAGRIEKIPDDVPTNLDGSFKTKGSQVVRWLNNWCYIVLVSDDRAKRGGLLPKCFFPLGKTPAQGDLFDHMSDGQPAPSR